MQFWSICLTGNVNLVVLLPDFLYFGLFFFSPITSDDPQELVEMMQKILRADEITKIQVLGKGKRKRIEMIFSETEDSDLDKEEVSFCLSVPDIGRSVMELNGL